MVSAFGMKNTRRKRPSRLPTKADVKKLRPVIPDAELERVTKRAKTAEGNRHIQIPEVHEPTKPVLFLRGHRVSEANIALLRDLFRLRAPYARFHNRRNQSRLMEPMDIPDDFEYLCEKAEAGIFVMTSGTKKRPFRFYGGRVYNNELYDLMEFDVTLHKTIDPSTTKFLPVEGAKPLVMFQGACWDLSPEIQNSKNFFCDLFGGVKADKILLTGFDHCWVLTAAERYSPVKEERIVEIKVNHYSIQLKRGSTGDKNPEAALVDIGPSFTLTKGRYKLPGKTLAKAATRLPPEDYLKKAKNIMTNDLLEKRAKVWINEENSSELHIRHGR